MATKQAPTKREIAQKSEQSYWPIALAAVLTLTLVGLLLNPLLALAGAMLSLVTLVAWTTQRFQGLASETQVPEESLQPSAVIIGEAEVAAPRESGRHAGWWGLALFITTEAVLFGNLITAYLYLRISSPIWPPLGVPHRDLLFPGINTLILLLSGVPAWYGSRAIRRGDRWGLKVGLVFAAFLGAIFLAGQVYEYSKMGGVNLTSNVFLAGFFTLTGFHGVHVTAGIGLLLFVFVQSLRGRFSPQSSFSVEVASTYWHFVDAVWIVLFGVLYLFQ